MAELVEQLMGLLRKRNYEPMRPRELARRLGLNKARFGELKLALRDLLKEGRIEVAPNHTIRPRHAHGSVVGAFRRTSLGIGFVRPHPVEGKTGPEVRIREDDALD